MSDNVVEGFFRRIWVDGDPAAIDEMFCVNARAPGIGTDLTVSPEDFHVMVPALRALVRDITVDFTQSVDMGDWTWSLVRVEGYSVATERRAAISGQVMSRLVDGRVAEAYNHFDFITFFEMLGLLPEDTMTLCMTGQRIA